MKWTSSANGSSERSKSVSQNFWVLKKLKILQYKPLTAQNTQECTETNICTRANVMLTKKLAKGSIPGLHIAELTLPLSMGRVIDVDLPCVNKAIHKSCYKMDWIVSMQFLKTVSFGFDRVKDVQILKSVVLLVEV